MDSTLDWNIPKTEEGLQQVLAILGEARAQSDGATEARALLELAFLVKWVRSDNDDPPFVRSHVLARQALDIYRRLGDKPGQIAALLSAAPFELKRNQRKMLKEAEELAVLTGNDFEIARVLSARARMIALENREEANALHLDALARFRKLDNKSGIANSLFSLAISHGSNSDRVGYGLEAAENYREAGDLENAGRACQLAFMNCEGLAEIAAIEPEIHRALEVAQSIGDRSTERQCYKHLARVAEHRKETDKAVTYLRWASQLEDSHGLSATEKWEEDVQSFKSLISLVKRMGNKELASAFAEELRRLKAAKPKS